MEWKRIPSTRSPEAGLGPTGKRGGGHGGWEWAVRPRAFPPCLSAGRGWVVSTSPSPQKRSTGLGICNGSAITPGYCYLFLVFFFLAVPWGLWDLSSPDQGLNPCPQQWKCAVLTTGPPGNSPLLPSTSNTNKGYNRSKWYLPWESKWGLLPGFLKTPALPTLHLNIIHNLPEAWNARSSHYWSTMCGCFTYTSTGLLSIESLALPVTISQVLF